MDALLSLPADMLSQASKLMKDASVLRRLEFAAGFYSPDMPNYSDYILAFAVKGKEDRNCLDPEQALQLVENIQYLDSEVFVPEVELVKEIVSVKRSGSDMPLGIILLSSNNECKNCRSKLYIRGSRVANVTIYDDRLGTVPATHYTRYCRKKGCSFQQHYGYYTQGDCGEVRYDRDWWTLPYFMSSRETALSMDMLCRLDKEILIGQISYKQRAELYNDIHGYSRKSTDDRYVLIDCIVVGGSDR